MVTQLDDLGCAPNFFEVCTAPRIELCLPAGRRGHQPSAWFLGVRVRGPAESRRLRRVGSWVAGWQVKNRCLALLSWLDWLANAG